MEGGEEGERRGGSQGRARGGSRWQATSTQILAHLHVPTPRTHAAKTSQKHNTPSEGIPINKYTDSTTNATTSPFTNIQATGSAQPRSVYRKPCNKRFTTPTPHKTDKYEPYVIQENHQTTSLPSDSIDITPERVKRNQKQQNKQLARTR